MLYTHIYILIIFFNKEIKAFYENQLVSKVRLYLEDKMELSNEYTTVIVSRIHSNNVQCQFYPGKSNHSLRNMIVPNIFFCQTNHNPN